jgi:hypothetical protein
MEQQLSKKEKQWKKWETETIPMLLKPYISLLRKTESLRISALQLTSKPVDCTCPFAVH